MADTPTDNQAEMNGMPLLEAVPTAAVGTEERLALEQGIRALPPERYALEKLRAAFGVERT